MSSNCPHDLKYTDSHEWMRVDGNEVTIGITDHAQSQLGDLVYVEVPMLGDEAFVGREVAVVESVKTAADVYSPVTGQIISVNEALTAQPELVNQDPYGKGWLFKIALQNPSELDAYMNAAAYAEKNPD